MKVKTYICNLLAVAAVTAFVSPLWAADPVLMATKVSGDGPLNDPSASYWNGVKPMEVTLEPQTTVAPTQPNGTIDKMNVRAVQNGKYIGLLLEWKDAAVDHLMTTDHFGDQVAVELPVTYNKDDLPNIMMGESGKPVSVWQWRAPLQYDKDKGKPSTKDLYPNSHYDMYPDQILPAETAKLYTGAHGLQNPVSDGKKSAIMEMVAEGFGTLTFVGDQQLVDGNGLHKDGQWHVALTYPLQSATGVQLAKGGETALGFALWEGGNKDVGSRKSWAPTWLTLQLPQ
ncbi:MAG: hypothetical protein HQL73_07850 [Magnetococcales bacterium]|nr:hypothetical protein [Magnetococcales bacterium]